MAGQSRQNRGAKQPGTLIRRLSSVPTTLWLITALWGALLLGASVLWPMSYGYDEPTHIDMAYVYSTNPFHFFGPGQLSLTEASVGMQGQMPRYPFAVRLADAPILPRSERPTFAQLGGHAFSQVGQPNQMVQHPPLYYWLEAAVLRVPGVSYLSWDLQVWLMRLGSVLMMLPLPVLCWAATRRLLIGRQQAENPSDTATPEGVVMNDNVSRLAVLAAVIPLTVPNLIRDGSSVTNDTLLVLTTSVLLYLLSRVLTGDLTRRTAVWVAVSLAAALWTKGLALVLPPIVLAAYLVGWWRWPNPASRMRTLWPPLAIAAAGGVVGGLWWLRNLIDYGTVQVNGFGPGYNRVLYGPPDNVGTFTHFVPSFISGFVMRIWGGVGLPDTPSPGPFIIYGWFFVVLLGVVAALLVKGNAGGRLRGLVLISAPVLTVLVVADGSFSTYEHWSNALAGVQGRYLYGALVAVAALATIGWIQMTHRRVHAVFIPVVLVGAILTNATVWNMILRSWYEPLRGAGPVAGMKTAIHALLRWSPLPSAVTLLLVILAPAALSLVTVVATIRDARQLHRTLGRDAEPAGVPDPVVV
jgi:4-amino-4-deoxy-L-arabinose transferase-like glycosyltransferase